MPPRSPRLPGPLQMATLGLDRKPSLVEGHHNSVRTPATLVSKLPPKLTDVSGDSQNGLEQKGVRHPIDENLLLSRIRQSMQAINTDQLK